VLPLYLAGARVLEVVPVLPLVGKVALGVGALSYAGTFSRPSCSSPARDPVTDEFGRAQRSELENSTSRRMP